MGRRFGIASLLASLYWVRRLLRSLRNAEKELRDAKRKVEKLSELKQSERSGRIQAEKELRQLRLKLNSTMKDSYPSKSEDSNVDSDLVSTTESDGHSFIPIGHVRTCFPKRSGTPRQPHLVPAARGVLTLKAELPKDLLSGLELYSHCWVIYVFHQNTDLHQDWKKIKGKVTVPRLNGGRVGVLATRSPHRPNAIGLSSAKIDGISSNGKVIELSGVDLVDQSPILDIKPYVPFCDSLAFAETPEWVRRDRDQGLEPLEIAEVSISDEVRGKLEACWMASNDEEEKRNKTLARENKEGKTKKKKKKNDRNGEVVALYKTFADFLSLVQQVLARDIRSLHQRTKEKAENKGSNKRVNETNNVVNHLYLLGKIDVSYLQNEREICVTDAKLL